MKKLALTLLLALSAFLSACKKDKIEVDQEKVFIQKNLPADTTPGYVSAWYLVLKPDGSADIAPGGDIVYRGKHDIKGSLLKVKTDNTTFEFDILSATEIKEKKYGVILWIRE
ncbi:hypothetical protein ACFQ3S_11255 [Mucilaginibacter terrae]|uniref:hypothetical protein n=1 Tax=Mucilaginibacter terrae TaxID=1955052 RepID=UPI0036267CF4